MTRLSTYGASDNRLSSITENAAAFRSYSYDGAGNTITETRPGESLVYGYNNRNRLVSVTKNSVSWATYGYNALEQMVSRSSSSPAAPLGTIHYLYDLDGHLIAEADGATGAVLRDYIWLPANDNGNPAPGGAFSDDLAIAGAGNDNSPPDFPLAVIDGVNTATPATYQVHSDHLGRPVAMTDGAKATVWSATWTPWGEVQSLTGSAVNNLRFPGQYFLIETGHAYNWHRTYDPVSGRYIQPDPLRFVDGPSVYAYAGNSPLILTDPRGLVAYPNSRKPSGVPNGGTQMCERVDCDDGYIKCLEARGGLIKGGSICGKMRDYCRRGHPTIFAPGIMGVP